MCPTTLVFTSACEMREERPEGSVVLTFPCQLAVVRLFARNDLLHQLVVAAVAHCLDDVSHLETNTKMGGKTHSPTQREEYIKEMNPSVKSYTFDQWQKNPSNVVKSLELCASGKDRRTI